MSDKARTERIQQVYGARTSAEVAERYDDWAAAYDADLEALGFSAPRVAALLVLEGHTHLSAFNAADEMIPHVRAFIRRIEDSR